MDRWVLWVITYGYLLGLLLSEWGLVTSSTVLTTDHYALSDSCGSDMVILGGLFFAISFHSVPIIADPSA